MNQLHPNVFRHARELLTRGRCRDAFAVTVVRPSVTREIGSIEGLVGALDEYEHEQPTEFCAYCPAGALIVAAAKAGYVGEDYPAELVALANHLLGESLTTDYNPSGVDPVDVIANWNDADIRSDEEVLEAFDAIIGQLSETEGGVPMV